MDVATQVVFVQMPVLLVVGVAVASLAWWYHEGAVRQLLDGRRSSALKALGMVALVAAWLVVTAVSWWCLFLGAYLAVLVMYVLFGVVGGWVTLAASALLFTAAPFVWGVILFGLARREFPSASRSQHIAPPQRARALPG